MLFRSKGLASGFPLSGIAARSELMQHSPVGSQGGTYGGNAVSCAAAVATLQTLEEEGLIENSARMGAKLMERLKALQDQYPAIGNVRGLGLMVGVEFTSAAGDPDAAAAKAVIKECLDRKLILLSCGTYGNVIRWIAPLVISDSHLDEALDIFADALEAVAA